MRIPSMFKTPRHRTFDHKPIIYDERKERKLKLEQLVEDQKNGKLSDEARRARLDNIFGKHWSVSKTDRKQQSVNQQLRLLVIMGILVGLVWFVFNWA